MTARTLLIFIFSGLFSFVSYSQSEPPPDDSDFQSWNDISLTVPLNKKVDLYVPFTLRLAKNINSFSEAKAGAGVVLKLTKRLAVTPFFQYIRSQNSSGVYRTEYRYIVRGVYRFPTSRFGLSHRSQYEYRDRQGRNTWRYRPLITIDKQLPEKFSGGLKVFLTEELFYDSLPGRFSRNRISAGITKTLNKSMSLDLYYLRQDDSFSRPGVVHAVGTGWKIKL